MNSRKMLIELGYKNQTYAKLMPNSCQTYAKLMPNLKNAKHGTICAKSYVTMYSYLGFVQTLVKHVPNTCQIWHEFGKSLVLILLAFFLNSC